MKFNSYFIIARLFPGILSSIPFFVLHFFLLSPKLGKFWGELLGIKIASDITVAFVLLFLLIQLSRYISKEILEKKIFSNGLSLPTTDFLLHTDANFSKEYTRKIHEKIKTDFKIDVPSEQEEKDDQPHSRKIIMEAVNHIRAKVKNGRLVNQHNAEYGFWRNLSGGSVVASLMSIIDFIIFSVIYTNTVALFVSLALVIIYLAQMYFAKSLVNAAGNDYARVLIQEYMAL